MAVARVVSVRITSYAGGVIMMIPTSGGSSSRHRVTRGQKTPGHAHRGGRRRAPRKITASRPPPTPALIDSTTITTVGPRGIPREGSFKILYGLINHLIACASRFLPETAHPVISDD